MTGPAEGVQTGGTHGAMRDDVLAADESREAEPSGEDQPDVDAAPDGTPTGGVPAGTDAGTVQLRAELARWLDRADFPSTGADLVGAARDHRAPDAVADELSRLPDGVTFTRIGDVVRALGHATED